MFIHESEDMVRPMPVLQTTSNTQFHHEEESWEGVRI